MRSALSLPSLPGQLWPGLKPSVNVQSIDQTELVMATSLEKTSLNSNLYRRFISTMCHTVTVVEGLG